MFDNSALTVHDDKNEYFVRAKYKSSGAVLMMIFSLPHKNRQHKQSHPNK